MLDRVSPGGQMHGVELSETMLEEARRRHRAECADGRLALHAGTLGDLPLEDDALDGLITTNTVYFVEDIGRAFSELARVLRPTGRAVVGVGDPEWMASLPVVEHAFRLRPVGELVALLRQAGFADVRRERVGKGDRDFHLLVADAGGGSPHP